MLNQIAPSSTLSWQINDVQPLQNKLQDWMKYQVVSDVIQQGYATQQAYMWDHNARLIVIARQMVSVFA